MSGLQVKLVLYYLLLLLYVVDYQISSEICHFEVLTVFFLSEFILFSSGND